MLGLGENIQYIHISLFSAYCKINTVVILYTNELILPFETLCCLTLIVSTILMNVQILGDRVVKVTFVCVNKMHTRYIGAYRSTHFYHTSNISHVKQSISPGIVIQPGYFLYLLDRLIFPLAWRYNTIYSHLVILGVL